MKLWNYLNKNFLHSDNNYLKDIAVSYKDTSTAIQITSERILGDVDNFKKATEQAFKELREENKNVSNETAQKLIDNIDYLQTDIRAYYFFVRGLMDILSMVIKEGTLWKEIQPKDSMHDLLKKIKEGRLNNEFFGGLFNKCKWFFDFRDERDNLLHEMHTIMMIGDSRGMTFQIAKQGDKVSNFISKIIEEFVKDTNDGLDIVKDFITENLSKKQNNI